MSQKEKPIGNVIDEFLSVYGYGDRIIQYHILKHWEELVGEAIARQTTEVKYMNHRLMLRFSSPVLKDAIMMQKTMLIERINALLGKNCINEISFL